MLRTIALVCSVADVPAAEALCLASGNTARYRLRTCRVSPW
jgi:hypothetical protein